MQVTVAVTFGGGVPYPPVQSIKCDCLENECPIVCLPLPAGVQAM
jgi:hypothetical protein